MYKILLLVHRILLLVVMMLARCLILLILAASLRDMLVFRHLIIIDLVWGKFHLRVLTLLEAVVALHCLARAR